MRHGSNCNYSPTCCASSSALWSVHVIVWPTPVWLTTLYPISSSLLRTTLGGFEHLYSLLQGNKISTYGSNFQLFSNSSGFILAVILHWFLSTSLYKLYKCDIRILIRIIFFVNCLGFIQNFFFYYIFVFFETNVLFAMHLIISNTNISSWNQ